MFSAISVTRSEPGRPCWADIITSNLGTTKVEAVRDESGFFGQLALWNLGYLRIAHVKLRGAAVRGMRRRANGGRPAFSWLAASLGGAFELCYNGRSSVMEPGRMAILDARRTYVTTFAANSEVLWMRVPHAFLGAQFAGPTQIIIDGVSGAGRVAFDTLKSVLGQATCLHARQGQLVADGLVKVIAAASVDLADARGRESTTCALTLRRVKTFVVENLSDDSLSAESVAAANGLTARYINKLFEREGSSLMRWLWQQRLEAARAALTGAEPESRSVGDVAYAYGFKSASHFSHAFRRQFGYPPRAAKRAEESRADA
jgi:AraC family transcriptional activator of tynA and feaB